jgi:hypothetical protein
MLSKYPYYRLKIRCEDFDGEVLVKNPFEFDEAFKDVKVETKELLSIKIHYCSLLSKSLKK